MLEILVGKTLTEVVYGKLIYAQVNDIFVMTDTKEKYRLHSEGSFIGGTDGDFSSVLNSPILKAESVVRTKGMQVPPGMSFCGAYRVSTAQGSVVMYWVGKPCNSCGTGCNAPVGSFGGGSCLNLVKEK